MEIRKRLGNWLGTGRIETNLAILYHDANMLGKAGEYHRNALKNYQKGEADQLEMAGGYTNLGNVAYQLDSFAFAKNYYLSALELYQNIRDSLGISDVRNGLGLLYQKMGRFDAAEREFLAAYELAKRLKYPEGQCDILINLGTNDELLNRFSHAAEWYRKSLDIAEELNLNIQIQIALGRLAATLIEIGQPDSAWVINLRMLALRDSMDIQSTSSAIADKEVKYNLNDIRQQKSILEKEKIIQLNEIQHKTTQRNALLATAIGILLIAILIWLLLRSRLQTTRLKAVQREAETRENIATLIRQGEAQVFHAMFEGKEQERLRIATDLHDNLGSLLSTVKLYFSALESRLADLPPDSRDHLTTATRLMDDAVGEVRRIAHDLVNGTLVKVGLVAALEEMGRTIAQTGQTDVEVLSHGIHKRLDQETEIALFRVVQELLNNTLRHAAAEHVTIQLNRIDGLLSLMVEDDGKGFDPAKTSGRNGLGLQSVRNRVTGLGGTVNFDSQPGRGTTVVIEIPIAESMANGR
jgi:hypothetical protein